MKKKNSLGPFVCPAIFALLIWNVAVAQAPLSFPAAAHPQAWLAQPAAIANGGKAFAAAYGGFGGANSATGIGVIFPETGFLNAEAKNQILDALGSDNRLQTAASWGIMAGLRMDSLYLGLEYRHENTLMARFTAPTSLGLILNGNTPYRDQTLTESDARLYSLRSEAIGLRAARRFGSIQAGIGARLLLGRSLTALDRLNYTLYTAPEGERIDVQADYAAYQTSTSMPSGIGMAADAGLSWQAAPRWQAQVALLNLGFIRWQADQYVRSLDERFEGMNLSPLLSGTGSGNISFPDTLQARFLPEKSSTKLSLPSASRAMLGLQFQPDARQSIWLMGYSGLSRTAADQGRPTIQAGYQRQLFGWLNAGANFGFGGIEGFRAGLNANAKIQLNKQVFTINAHSENLLGLLLPDQGRGAWGAFGISWQIH